MAFRPSMPIALDAASITVLASCAKTDAGSRATTIVATARVFHMALPNPAGTAFHIIRRGSSYFAPSRTGANE